MIHSFLKRTFFLLVVILTIVASVNFFGDLINYFSRTYEKKIASIHLGGKNVTNIYNFNDRKLEKIIIESAAGCPEVVVIGSSRVMMIGKDYCPGKTFRNNGVTEASFEDLLAIVQLYTQKKDGFPKRILIGLDPWTLNVNGNLGRWVTLNHEFYGMSNALLNEHKKLPFKQAVKESMVPIELLFSLPNFRQSLRKLFNPQNPIATDTDNNESITKLTDGSVSYSKTKYYEGRPAEKKASIDRYMMNEVFHLEKFNELSSEYQSLLEHLIIYLRGRGVEIDFFLCPYHPRVYEFIAHNPRYIKVLESEVYFKALAAKYKINLIGSFNPAKNGLTDPDFYDAMHCNVEGLKKVIGSSLSGK